LKPSKHDPAPAGFFFSIFAFDASVFAQYIELPAWAAANRQAEADEKMRAIVQYLLLASRHKPVRAGQAYVRRSKIAPFNPRLVIDRAETAA
jgi:hypothetical protein